MESVCDDQKSSETRQLTGVIGFNVTAPHPWLSTAAEPSSSQQQRPAAACMFMFRLCAHLQHGSLTPSDCLKSMAGCCSRQRAGKQSSSRARVGVSEASHSLPGTSVVVGGRCLWGSGDPFASHIWSKTGKSCTASGTITAAGAGIVLLTLARGADGGARILRTTRAPCLCAVGAPYRSACQLGSQQCQWRGGRLHACDAHSSFDS